MRDIVVYFFQTDASIRFGVLFSGIGVEYTRQYVSRLDVSVIQIGYRMYPIWIHDVSYLDT